MKTKILCVVLAFVCLFCFAACEEKPPEGQLGIADFHVYENGRVILRMEEDYRDFGFRISNGGNVSTADKHGLSLDSISTSKGIKIGDTVEDVAAGYSNILFDFLTIQPIEGNVQERYDSMLLSDFLALNLQISEYGVAYSLFKIGDEYVYDEETLQNFYNLAQEAKNNKDETAYVVYRIGYTFESGIVTYIHLSKTNYGSPYSF